MRHGCLAVAVWFFGAWSAFSSAAGIDESQLLPVEEAFKASVSVRSDAILVDFDIAEGYYLVRERMRFAVDPPASLGEPVLPEGKLKEDPTFGMSTVYHQDMQARVPLLGSAVSAPFAFTLTYQGCADLGICYPPQRVKLMLSRDLPDDPSASTAALAAASSANSAPGLELNKSGAMVPGLSSGLSGAGSLLGQASAGTAMMDGANSDALPEQAAFGFEAIATGPHTLLLRFSPADGYYLYRDKTELRLQGVPDGYGLGLPSWPEASDHQDEHFGSVKVYFKQIEVPLELSRPIGPAAKINLHASFQGCKAQGICYPVMTRVIALDLPASGEAYVASASAPTALHASAANSAGTGTSTGTGTGTAARAIAPVSFWFAVFSALVGGLILNLMPCVLPVLSLKALSVLDSGKSRDYARSQSNWYTFGVLASFAVIGLIVIALSKTGAALGWGFQFQHSWFVSGLVVLMALIGLSLSGVVSFGSSLMGVGQSLTEDSGRKGAFFTGVLAVVVASPCTAPMMGAALAFAFVQPPVAAMTVFLALGLGLALPFLLLGHVPAIAARMPRPGAWMEGFKQVLAFPMYFTAVWLVWVLGQQKGIDAVGYVLVACVLVAWAAWWWERSKYREPRAWLATFGMLALLASAGWALWEIERLSAVTVGVSTSADLPKTPFSEAKLAELRRSGTPVFIDMTAAWCATCKVNERVALNTKSFKQALRDTAGVLMVGDWTNADPEISAYLKRYGAVGVPLYVVYPRGGGDGEVLPTILTPGIASGALRRAAQ